MKSITDSFQQMQSLIQYQRRIGSFGVVPNSFSRFLQFEKHLINFSDIFCEDFMGFVPSRVTLSLLFPTLHHDQLMMREKKDKLFSNVRIFTSRFSFIRNSKRPTEMFICCSFRLVLNRHILQAEKKKLLIQQILHFSSLINFVASSIFGLKKKRTNITERNTLHVNILSNIHYISKFLSDSRIRNR